MERTTWNFVPNDVWRGGTQGMFRAITRRARLSGNAPRIEVLMRSTTRLLVLSSVSALCFSMPLAANAGAAKHQPHPQAGHGHSQGHGHGKGHGKGPGHGKGHGHQKCAFTAVGHASSVDVEAATLTVADKGGTRALHGQSVDILVPESTKVIVNDQPGSLSDVPVNAHVVVKGTGCNSDLTATRIVAASNQDSSTDS
jgi:hypothetical protein